MSTALDVAVEIAGAVSNCAANRLPMDVVAVANEISSRHPSAGYSCEELAATLTDEVGSAGLSTASRPTPRM